jgi:hypothetical protein
MTPGTRSGGGAEKDKHSAENYKNSAENDEIKCRKKVPKQVATLSNINEYSDRFKSLAETHNVPNHITELFNPEFEGKPDVVVNDECERIFQTMSFSKEDQEAVEISTRDQSAVSEWKKQGQSAPIRPIVGVVISWNQKSF